MKVSLADPADVRFRTYLNYVRHVEHLATQMDAAESCERITQSRSFRRIQGSPDVGVGTIGHVLRNAWFTELQLAASAAKPEMIPYANQWAPIQVYYSVYLTSRAYLRASLQQVGRDHRATLAAMSKEVEQRNYLLPPPFNAYCRGVPTLKRADFAGVPSASCRRPHNSLATHTDPWTSYAALLRTTRERLLDARVKGWKLKNDKKKIPGVAKKAIVDGLGPTTIFHILFRLRIRTNYEDADDFLSALHDHDAAQAYNSALRSICWRLMLAMEMLIARYVGKRAFGTLVNDFVERDPSGHASELAMQRFEVYSECW